MITYCTNIHPGESWSETWGALRRHLPEVKRALAPGRPFPVGLRLSAAAAAAVTSDQARAFADWLQAEDLFVPTLNGFPFGSFHGTQVKERVYLPDWRSPERVAYTKRLARLLALWQPAGLTGSISTVPLGFKGVAGSAQDPLLRRNLLEVLTELERLRQETGRTMLLALEPEPGCLLETTAEVVDWFAAMAFSPPYRDLIGVCYDCCHQAVQFEEPADSLRLLFDAGIPIGKVQVSSALALRDPAPSSFDGFDEPCYLHQVVVRRTDGSLARYRDLPEARARHRREPGDEWRCHFHLPVFLERVGELGTTQGFLRQALPLFPDRLLFEIETYTFDILPASLRLPRVTESIVRELAWLEGELHAAHRCL